MRWIVTDNIYKETWRQLLEFSNADLVIDKISHFHGPAKNGAISENYKKQAKQARVCVLQAKEYFDAALSSTVFTGPNHCYYGAISLASLILLILGDGSKSLDYLRKNNANNHHGLDFTVGCNAVTASKELNLLNESRAQILSHGHFFNFYNTLPDFGYMHGMITRERGATISLDRQAIGRYKVPSFESIIGKKKRLIDLLKTIPDLAEDLRRFGINLSYSNAVHEVLVRENTQVMHKWRLHDCHSESDREKMLQCFKFESRLANSVLVEGIETTSGGAIIHFSVDCDNAHFSYPDGRETLNHDLIYYADDISGHEIIDMYMAAYQLSMLSRYFPDIWISCVESQCRAAKLIERAVEIIIKKFPILCLSLLNDEETIISTHLMPGLKR